MKSSANELKKFEGDFDAKLYIDKLTRKPLQDQRDRAETPQFNPTPFIKSFESALKQLEQLSDEIDKGISTVFKEKERAQRKYKQSMEQQQQNFQKTIEKFNQIDKQIYDRGNAAVRIGERLETVERQREKADEAKMLIERFSQLNRQQQLPAIMTDDSKIHERAALIKKLLTLVRSQDLESIPSKTQLGKQRVEECSNALENRLLQMFDQAQAENDYKKMQECSRTLWSFNGGSSVVRRYISQQPIFLNSALWNAEGATLGKKKIEELFAQVKETCQREKIITPKVFPDHGSIVMKQLLEKVFLQYIQRLLELALPNPSGESGLREWLIILELIFDLTNDLITEVSSYNITDLDLENIRLTLFSDYIDEYNEREISWLTTLYKGKLKQYKSLMESNQSNNPSQSGKNFEMIELSGKMAIEFIHANKESIGRCTKIVKHENLAQSVHAILSQLIKYLGYQYLDSILDVASKVEQQTNKNISQFFLLVQQVTHTVVLFLEYFQASIFPNISTEENQKMQCILEKNALVASLESKIHPGLERAIKFVIDNVNSILAAEQKKTDYRVKEDQVMDGHEYTVACKKTIEYLSKHHNTVKSTLDGGNAKNYLTQLGIALYEALLAHVKRQQISLGLGGMMLLRDLTQYKEFAKQFGSPIVTEKFAILRDVANIHIVPSENIQTLIEDSHLANMDREELNLIIQLRSDMQSPTSTPTTPASWRTKMGIDRLSTLK